MNETNTKRTVQEWVDFLAKRYDGTPLEGEYWSWVNAAYPFGDEDEESTAAAWEETIDSVLGSFNSNDWKEIGKRDAGSLSNQELAEIGYENPNCNGTPWSDGEPKEAKEVASIYLEELASTDVAAKIEAAIEGATDDYNLGYVEVVEAAIEEIANERSAHLARADAAGWRICVFGLPGASVHVARVAEPGMANGVSEEIFQPGPFGPYDSSILTPTEADCCNWRDGNPIYRDEVDSILSQID